VSSDLPYTASLLSPGQRQVSILDRRGKLDGTGRQLSISRNGKFSAPISPTKTCGDLIRPVLRREV